MNLNQVTVGCDDVDASVAFYRTLGLKLIVKDVHYARFECPDGDATFSVHKADELAPGAGPLVYFECEDLDERVRALAAQGIRIDAPPQDQPWLWREAYLCDPAGNRICLYRAGRNRKNPPWRVEG
jgi:catechol 2,3-dioxygenase-like lactoylglutathione lyase family enzyme